MMRNCLKTNIQIFIVNLLCFFFLIIGLQNGSIRKKINFVFADSINLPIGFIIGSSFFSGSLIGGFVYSLSKDI